MRLKIIFLTVLLVSNGFNVARPDEWSLWRGDAQSTGVSQSRLPEEPEKAWEFTVEDGAFDATPLIADGRVYIPDLDGEIYCLDLKTGQQIWKMETETGFLASAAYRDGLLVAADYDGFIWGIDAKAGTEKWKFETQAQIDSGANFYESLVLVASEDGILYALESESGELKWKYESGDQLRCSPTVAGSSTFLGGCDGQLHVVDLKTGEATGELLPLQSPTGSTPATDGKFVAIPTHSGPIFAFDLETRKQLWVYEDGQRSPEVRTSPALTEELVLVATRSRRILAVQRSDGSLVWEALLRKRADSSPVVADGRVWVTAFDGRIYALDLKTGDEKWQTEIRGGFVASPAIAENSLVVATSKGSVICFR